MLATKDYKKFQVLDSARTVVHEFEGAVLAHKALPGDSVRIAGPGVELVERGEKRLLVGVLCLTSKYMYGMTGHGVPIYLCETMNKGWPSFRVACKEKDRSQNLLISFQFDSWDEAELPRGGLVEILGPVEDPAAEALALALIASPQNAPRPKTLPLITDFKRTKLSVGTFNIDPPGCKDIDDVISLWEEDGIWNLAISIADVAAFVSLNPELRFAEKIGQTLYSEGYAIRPLFPYKFSENLFSLLPGEERFTLTLFAKWDPGSGTLYGFQFKECILRNWASYTYENCYSCTELNMEVLKDICSSIGEDSHDSHKWIECLMILYNCQAAAILKEKDAGLLRSHGAPEKDQLLKMESLGLPAKQLAYPAAIYATTQEDTGHWGLATSGPRMQGMHKSCYCHASSPIRRYADILNQEVLKGVLQGNYKKYALTLNTLNKKAKAYERDKNFIECILGSQPQPIEGIIVDSKRIYIVPWKHMIKTEHGFTEGEKVWVGFFPGVTNRSWKRRVVYRVEKI